MAEIKDSGTRREFETGAVRDMAEGKGRCDLLPLDACAELVKDQVLDSIAKYQDKPDEAYLAEALHHFTAARKWDYPTMLLELSKHFEDGAKKYGEGNWKKGLPESCYIDSAVRHYLKWCRGDEDERHDRAFCWNILCLMWTHEHITVGG